jgi:hypothetical protein
MEEYGQFHTMVALAVGKELIVAIGLASELV